MSAVLLVLFPIALQLGFVFIGGQAGRLLDVRQMKELFPRIVSGFAVGFLVGGLLGIPLLALLGSTEHLLLATTAAQLAFLGLLLETERRFPRFAPRRPRTPLRSRAHPCGRSSPRASPCYCSCTRCCRRWARGSSTSSCSTARRRSTAATTSRGLRYTAALNLADILFLALLAGPLMRRFGLRLGLVLNPAAVAVVLAAMAVVVAGPGAAVRALRSRACSGSPTSRRRTARPARRSTRRTR